MYSWEFLPILYFQLGSLPECSGGSRGGKMEIGCPAGQICVWGPSSSAPEKLNFSSNSPGFGCQEASSPSSSQALTLLLCGACETPANVEGGNQGSRGSSAGGREASGTLPLLPQEPRQYHTNPGFSLQPTEKNPGRKPPWLS